MHDIEHRLHIIGDRQAGKTDMALAYASFVIRHGKNVAHYSYSYPYVQNLVERFAYEHLNEDRQKLYRSSGQQRVVDISGGTIYFTTPRGCESRLRGVAIHTVILDDIEVWDDFSIRHQHPDVTHIVRTVF